MRAHRLAFQEVSLRAHYGEIQEATLRVRFERDNVYGVIPEIFSKRPYVQFSPSSREEESELGDASEPLAHERDSAYETYEHPAHHLRGAMIMRWIPVSRAHSEDVMRLKGRKAQGDGRKR